MSKATEVVALLERLVYPAARHPTKQFHTHVDELRTALAGATDEQLEHIQRILVLARQHCAAEALHEYAAHCTNCGRDCLDHAGGKCLFGPTTYVPCGCHLSGDEYRQLELGQRIETIKLIRTRSGLTLYNAKLLFDAAKKFHYPERR